MSIKQNLYVLYYRVRLNVLVSLLYYSFNNSIILGKIIFSLLNSLNKNSVEAIFSNHSNTSPLFLYSKFSTFVKSVLPSKLPKLCIVVIVGIPNSVNSNILVLLSNTAQYISFLKSTILLEPVITVTLLLI